MHLPPSIKRLAFVPAYGTASPHLQTILPMLLHKKWKEPLSESMIIPLKDGARLLCKVSTPPAWNYAHKTAVFVHGCGGTHASNYVVRISGKFYRAGCRIVRINLRGALGKSDPVNRPYHGGCSEDLLEALHAIKSSAPHSPIVLIGFSLGGNIALKLLGEMGSEASLLLEKTIAICPPIDLHYTAHALQNSSNRLYHLYYMRSLKKTAQRWIGRHRLKSIIDYDQCVTAPQWGFKDAYDYYQKCSSYRFLPMIRQECHVIFAGDDPFIDYRACFQGGSFPPQVNIWLSTYGGHMGFWGWTGGEHGYYWLDRTLIEKFL